LFWSTSGSIERFSVADGRAVTVVDNLAEVRAAAVDHVNRKLVWMSAAEDPVSRASHFRLEVSDLDGSRRSAGCRLPPSSTSEVLIRNRFL
jgi:hypothetical protein